MRWCTLHHEIAKNAHMNLTFKFQRKPKMMWKGERKFRDCLEILLACVCWWSSGLSKQNQVHLTCLMTRKFFQVLHLFFTSLKHSRSLKMMLFLRNLNFFLNYETFFWIFLNSMQQKLMNHILAFCYFL